MSFPKRLIVRQMDDGENGEEKFLLAEPYFPKDVKQLSESHGETVAIYELKSYGRVQVSVKVEEFPA